MIKTASSRAPKLRIIGGQWRSRRLEVPAGTAVRPTPDRVRETIFNWLAPRLAGAHCLDLYAGSGALGFEALSRGAADACLVERDPKLVAALERNAAVLGAHTRVVRATAAAFLAGPVVTRFDIVFLDPPYAIDLEPLLAPLAAHVADAGLVYMERPAGQGLPEGEGISWYRTSRAGAVAFGLAAIGARE